MPQPAYQLSSARTGIHVPSRVVSNFALAIRNQAIKRFVSSGISQVLLHAHHPRVDSEGQRFANQRLVAFASFHFDGLRGCTTYLAPGRALAAVPNPIYVFQRVY